MIPYLYKQTGSSMLHQIFHAIDPGYDDPLAGGHRLHHGQREAFITSGEHKNVRSMKTTPFP